MARLITKEEVSAVTYDALLRLAYELPEDIEAGLRAAAERETSERARAALQLLLENARIARNDRVAICQDTGSVWACLEIGPDVMVAGDVLDDVNEAVARAYE